MLHWMHTSEVNLLWIQCIHSSRCDIYTDVLWFYYESIKKNSFIYRFKTGANFSFCLLRIYVEKMISKNFWDLSNLIFYCNILCYSVNWITQYIKHSVGQIEKSILFMTSDMCVRHKTLWYQSSAIQLFHENTVGRVHM